MLFWSNDISHSMVQYGSRLIPLPSAEPQQQELISLMKEPSLYLQFLLLQCCYVCRSTNYISSWIRETELI